MTEIDSIIYGTEHATSQKRFSGQHASIVDIGLDNLNEEESNPFPEADLGDYDGDEVFNGSFGGVGNVNSSGFFAVD